MAQRFKLMNESRSAGDLQKAREQTWWLIENAPDLMEAATATRMLLAPGPTSANDEERQRLREAWRRQARDHSSSASVQANASQIASVFQSRFEAEELLLRARKLEPANQKYLLQLVSLYTYALPGWGNEPNPPSESAAFQAKVISELETTTDAQLAGLVGERLTAGQTVISASQSAQEEAALRDRLRKRNQLAAKYLARARSLEPDNENWAGSLKRATEEPRIVRFPDPAPGVKRITVGGMVQQAKMVRMVNPVYPQEAKAARIQGTVRYNVILATDGTIRHMTLIDGHPVLVSAATEAVKQWVYNPTLLNGEPVEVVTQIDVNFTLDETPTITGAMGGVHRIGGGGIGIGGSGTAATAATGEVHMIGGRVSAPFPIYKIEPEFPKGLPGDPAGGVVLLSIIVGRDGIVTVVKPLRGDPAFFENAIEAVKKWKFRPGMKDGQPVDVKANVEVNFRKL